MRTPVKLPGPAAQDQRYQMNRSLRALQNGGITGQGLYHGTMVQSGTIPAQHTDLIFSSIGEELGMLGCMAVLILLTAIIIIVSIFKQLHPILIIGIISAILFLSGLLFQTLKKEHKAGNPDYLTGLRIKNATPRQITDKRQIFKFILKQQP